MRVVSPYRPFPPESPSHRKLGPFDWVDALRMLRASVTRSCGCETIAITDRATILPVPSLRFDTQQSRLMPWIVEVSLAYLESPRFVVDTVFVSPDSLVMGDLRPYFSGDLTILVRSRKKYHNRPIINAVQWWPVAAREQLIAFYREVLAVAIALPEPLATWGADSESIRRVVAPITAGLHRRGGLRVSMMEAAAVMTSISARTIEQLQNGERVSAPLVPIVDFKGPERKRAMGAYFASVCR